MEINLIETMSSALALAVPAEYREKATHAVEEVIPKLVNTTLVAIASGERNVLNVHGFTYRTSDYEVPTVFAEMAKASTVYADSNAVQRAKPVWKFSADMIPKDVENPGALDDANLLDPYEYAIAVSRLTTKSYKLATTKLENGAVTLNDLGGVFAKDHSGFVYLTGSTIEPQVSIILGITDIIESQYRDVSKSMTGEEIVRWMSRKLTETQSS